MEIRFYGCYTMDLESRLRHVFNKLPSCLFNADTPLILMSPALYKASEKISNWDSDGYCDYKDINKYNPFKKEQHFVLQKIKLKVRDSEDKQIIVRSVLHGFGHILDLMGGDLEKSPSQRELFKKIVDMEFYNAFVDRYAGNETSYYRQPQEYFAEMFMEYILNPERLKNNAHMTYRYLEMEIAYADNVYPDSKIPA